MISWIKGELIDLWQTNNKFFILLNCHGLGYEIQIIESFFKELNINKNHNDDLVLWLKHIKKEDSDLLFGFISSFFVGAFACKLMIKIVKNSKLKYFAFYCMIIGSSIVFYSFFNA